MFTLLSRLAWFVSFLLGVFFMILLGGIWSGYDFFDEGLIILFWGIMIGIMIKRIFLPYSLIEEAVMKKLNRDQSINPNKTKNDNTTNTISSWIVQNEKILEMLPFKNSNENENTADSSQVQNSNISNSFKENTTPEITTIPEEPSKLWLWIQSFFSDRPLAKIWGILLFLGALFLLWLIFIWIGPVWRVLMGIWFGFFLVFIGVWFDAKDIKTEARVLFGIGIAVNYLTILFGRHMITGSTALISDGFATFALLLNTGFAITLALVYRSRVLLGFAFIFAYATPFLVGSEKSSILLLSIYTTIITLAISIINGFYARMEESESIKYLQWIAIVGMTALFSVAGVTATTDELVIVFGWLWISVTALAIFVYQQKESPIAIFIAAYIVLMISTIVNSTLFLLPFCIIALLIFSLFFIFQNLIAIASLVWFWIISFLLGLFGFWAGWAESIGMLFLVGISVFLLLGFASIKLMSHLLASVALVWFGILTFLGIVTVDMNLAMESTTILLVKVMSILLLVGASIFTLHLRDAFVFFLAALMSWILMVYPNTFDTHVGITLISFLIYIFGVLIIPYILTRSEKPIAQKGFLLVSLPLSALIISWGIYELGHEIFPWIAMGLAYIVQALVYLGYAIVVWSKFLPTVSQSTQGTVNQDNKNMLLVLFALPLSLFTFSFAFLFQDVPGVMSLAWVIESAILYLIAIRMNDTRIFTAAHLVLAIGIIKEVTLIDIMQARDWSMFGILVLMLVSIMASLMILRWEKQYRRIPYDILHIFSILSIGYGIRIIIPSTAHGWSLLGIAFLIFIINYFYSQFGKKIHQIFAIFLFGFLCLGFIDRFNSLELTVPYLFVQYSALVLILLIGYSWYRANTVMGSINLGISMIGFLWISSLYIDKFYGIFAVSIYLTLIASFLIIRGIINDSPRLRTLGLYIGLFVLVKILFYDIWNGDGNTITRVIALMIAGWLMIYLSQLYGKYVSRGWSEELSVFNIIGKSFLSSEESDSSHEKSNSSTNNQYVDEQNPFIGELDTELKNVSVSAYSAVIFSTPSESFTVKRASVIKIARHITSTLKRSKFAPNELESAYNYVLHNISSGMQKTELDNLLVKIKKWISEWGSVEFVEKVSK